MEMELQAHLVVGLNQEALGCVPDETKLIWGCSGLSLCLVGSCLHWGGGEHIE
jgi:hypothetical protein